jgi:hypothetical protein
LFCREPKCGSNLIHYLVSTWRAAKAVKAFGFNNGLGKGTAASQTTATAIGAGQKIGHNVNSRVFNNLELLSYKIEYYCSHGT